MAPTPVVLSFKRTAIRPSGLLDGGPFEPGLLVGDTPYVSGLLRSDLRSGQFPEEFESEVKVCLLNP